MTFFEPLGGLYRPLENPVWARIFPEPCLSPDTHKSCNYGHLFSFSSFSSSPKTFLQKLPKIYFFHNFYEGAPSSSIIASTPPLRLLPFLGNLYFLFFDIMSSWHHIKEGQNVDALNYLKHYINLFNIALDIIVNYLLFNYIFHIPLPI